MREIIRLISTPRESSLKLASLTVPRASVSTPIEKHLAKPSIPSPQRRSSAPPLPRPREGEDGPDSNAQRTVKQGRRTSAAVRQADWRGFDT
jgi:hypothetical protein